MRTSLAHQPSAHVALIYARVSQDTKGKERSVREQVKELTRWANDEGWEIFDTVEDNDRSASSFATKERKGWKKVKAIISDPNRVPTILLTWENSRASRDIEESVALINMCAETGMFWGYSDSVYDLTKPNDKARALHDAVDSQKESELTSVRVTRSMVGAAEEGKPHGRIPYGYRREYHPTTGEVRQIKDEATAPIVEEMASRFLSGESLRSIAKDLQARKVPTSTGTDSYGWQAYMIRRILTNPSINGKRKHKGKAFAKGKWDAIIDDVTFTRLQHRFDDPDRKSIRQREASHILTGVARCGVCKGPMGFAFKRYKDGRERGIYSCRMKNHVARHQEPLEDLVSEYIVSFMRTNDIGQDDPTPELLAARERVDALRERKAQYQARVADIDPDDFITMMNTLNGQIREAEKSIRVVSIPTVALAMSDAEDPEQYWDELGTTDQGRELQREILRSMLVIYVHPTSNWGSHAFDRSTIEIRRKQH